MTSSEWDVVVIGGGSAGLSAALTLVRARRRVLVIDAERPRNRFSGHLHALLGHDGTPPLDLLDAGRAEVRTYGGKISNGDVVSIVPTTEGLVVTTDDGDTVRARRVVVATGLADVLPAIPGLRERWGSGVAVCPYCDGWEVRDQRIGILATSPGSAFQAQLLRQWSDSVIYLENGTGEPTGEVAAALRARGIQVRMGAVAEVVSNDGRLDRVRFADGTDLGVDAIFTSPTFRPLDGVLEAAGAKRVDGPMGSFVEVDRFGRTSVDGVWAAGNVVDPAASLAVSIGDAARAAGMLNHELILEDVANAVANVS